MKKTPDKADVISVCIYRYTVQNVMINFIHPFLEYCSRYNDPGPVVSDTRIQSSTYYEEGFLRRDPPVG